MQSTRFCGYGRITGKVKLADDPEDRNDNRMNIPPLPAATANPGEAYARRIAVLSNQQLRLTRNHSILSGWRRFFLCLLVVLIILVEKEGLMAKLLFGGGPALLLVYLITRRVRIATALWTSRWLGRFYEQRRVCLEERWVGTGKAGRRYLEPDHPAATDLDLFGAGSLFERLATPCTRTGDDTLATWLLTPGSAEEVRSRQSAVVDLRDRLDLREDLALLASLAAAGSDVALLGRWGQSPSLSRSRAMRVLAATLPLLTILGLVTALFLDTGALPLGIAAGFLITFAMVLRKRSSVVLAPLEEHAYNLAAFGQLVDRLVRERFASPRMVELQAKLTGALAGQSVRSLHRLYRWAQFAPLLAIRPQVAMLLDRWRQRCSKGFAEQISAVGEIEALCALAAYSFECPEDPFPEVMDTLAAFEAEGLGHPLFPRARCVRNDLSLGSGGIQVLIISGSNMAGKSTLLRAVGVNLALALAGGPVRALKLRLTPLVTGATLRIQDSLLAGRSRFYAEILRVRRLLDMAEGSPPLLFLLDELFQGTNSADRRLGAEAVLQQLADAGAIGMVTTHDLALTEIAGQLGSRAANVHFEDQFQEGEVTFDYQMKPGVLRHTNGLVLMRAVGIRV